MPSATGCAASSSTAPRCSPSRARARCIRSTARWRSCSAPGANACTSGRPRAGGAALSAPAALLAPVDEQEVWASGVTYRRSATARVEESSVGDVYEMVYEAQRPELFLKAPAARVPAPGAPLRIRADSTWDVPEPELALVLDADGAIAGYLAADDVSSRSIEGANPLYLPRPRSTTTRSGCRGRSCWPATPAIRARPRSSSRSTATASGSSPARHRSPR